MAPGKKRKADIGAASAKQAQTAAADVTLSEQRRKLIAACSKMVSMGLCPGSAGSISLRIPGGVLVSVASAGLPGTELSEEDVVFMEQDRPASENNGEFWMHSDIHATIPEAVAVLHAQPTYCTALSCQRQGIPAFHYMVAVAGGKGIPCTEYGGFASRGPLSQRMLAALSQKRSVLLANHGVVCYGPSLDKALWLANETECLARQYISALSIGVQPTILGDTEMDIILAKFKSYGKQPSQLTNLSQFEQQHAIVPPPQRPAEALLAGGELPHLQERNKVIEACLRMNAMGINQGTSGNVSCRVPGGFLITASGVPYETMRPEQVVKMDLEGAYFGEFSPSSEWRMHYDLYRSVPEALAVVHAHPTYCTALSSQRRCIPAFHYMVAVAGGKEIKCAEYATFGSQDLSDAMLAALGTRQSTLLANHGMICYGEDLDQALWLANETECLAKQYLSALSTGSSPPTLPGKDMDNVLSKFKASRKRLDQSSRKTPRFLSQLCPCCEPQEVPITSMTPLANTRPVRTRPRSRRIIRRTSTPDAGHTC